MRQVVKALILDLVIHVEKNLVFHPFVMQQKLNKQWLLHNLHP